MMRLLGCLGRWLGTLAGAVAALAAAAAGYRIDPWRLPQRPPAPNRVIVAIPPPPPAVDRLSAIPAVSWAILAKALVGPRGAPSLELLDAWQAGTDCRAFERRPPSAAAAARAAAGQALAAPPDERIRISMVLPTRTADPIELPALDMVELPPVVLSVSAPCRLALAAAALPTRFIVSMTAREDWPRSIARPGQLGPGAPLTADLVAELQSVTAPAGGDVAAAAIRPVALYLWADDQRHGPLAALGHAAPGSQDVPVEAALRPSVPPPLRPPPLRPGEAPPVTAQPRRAIEITPLPAPISLARPAR